MIPYDDPTKNFTQNLIISSYLCMAEKEDPEKITVKGICEMAEINRTTFYNYFRDISHVEQEIFYYYHKLLFRQVDEAHQNGATARECFKIIITNLNEYKVLRFLLLREDFQSDLKEMLMESLKRSLIRTNGPTGPEYDLRLSFAFEGGMAAARYYIRHTDEISLEDAVDIMFRLWRDAMKWDLPRDERDIPLKPSGPVL